MILEPPNFKVTNIIFESYEHRSKIILQLLTSFVFLKVGFVCTLKQRLSNCSINCYTNVHVSLVLN
jgi:hypothetical protein